METSEKCIFQGILKCEDSVPRYWAKTETRGKKMEVQFSGHLEIWRECFQAVTDLLAGTTSATHFQLCIASLHQDLWKKPLKICPRKPTKRTKSKMKEQYYHPVAVRSSPCTFWIWMNEYVIYILSPIRLLPQFPYDLIDFFHFHCVEAHECSEREQTN